MGNKSPARKNQINKKGGEEGKKRAASAQRACNVAFTIVRHLIYTTRYRRASAKRAYDSTAFHSIHAGSSEKQREGAITGSARA